MCMSGVSRKKPRTISLKASNRVILVRSTLNRLNSDSNCKLSRGGQQVTTLWQVARRQLWSFAHTKQAPTLLCTNSTACPVNASTSNFPVPETGEACCRCRIKNCTKQTAKMVAPANTAWLPSAVEEAVRLHPPLITQLESQPCKG